MPTRAEIIREGRRIVSQLERCRGRTTDGTRANRRCAERFRADFSTLYRSILGSGVTAGARIRARNQLRNALMNDPVVRDALRRISVRGIN